MYHKRDMPLTLTDSEQRISRATVYAQATPFRPSQTVCAGTLSLAATRPVATGTVIHPRHMLLVSTNFFQDLSDHRREAQPQHQAREQGEWCSDHLVQRPGSSICAQVSVVPETGRRCDLELP